MIAISIGEDPSAYSSCSGRKIFKLSGVVYQRHVEKADVNNGPPCPPSLYHPRTPPNVNWANSYGDALGRAATEGKPIFLYFYSSACTYCAIFEKYTLSDREVTELLNTKFISVAVSTREHPGIAAMYGVFGTPTIYFLYPNSTPIGYIMGYVDKDSFVGYLRKVTVLTGEAYPEYRQVREDGASSLAGFSSLAISVMIAAATGAISTLSPCILPLIPAIFVLGMGADRRKIAAAIAGLVLSFTSMGMFAGSMGYYVREILSGILNLGVILLGLILLSDELSGFFYKLASAITPAFKLSKGNAVGAFTLGILMGVSWTPCIGPLIALSLLSSLASGDIAAGSIIMISYSLGFSASLLSVIKLVSKLKGDRGGYSDKLNTLISRGRMLKKLLGLALIAVGLAYTLYY